MNQDRHIWQDWARILHRWGVAEFTATLLETAGPLTTLGAQAVYLGQPLLRHTSPADQLDALAQVLEDSDQTRAFIAFLREKPAP